MNKNKDVQQEPEIEEIKVETDAANPVAADESGNEELLLEFEQVKEALVKAEEKANENYDLALRAKAESENTKRRLEKDLSNAHKFGTEKLAQELLAVIDGLEMGLAALDDDEATLEKFKEGIEMTHKMLLSAVEKSGIEAVSPEGEKFNPDLHQAMSIQENGEVEPNTILAVIQKGYTINKRLMRPAMVVVAKAEEKPKDNQIDEVV